MESVQRNGNMYMHVGMGKGSKWKRYKGQRGAQIASNRLPTISVKLPHQHVIFRNIISSAFRVDYYVHACLLRCQKGTKVIRKFRIAEKEILKNRNLALHSNLYVFSLQCQTALVGFQLERRTRKTAAASVFCVQQTIGLSPGRSARRTIIHRDL